MIASMESADFNSQADQPLSGEAAIAMVQQSLRLSRLQIGCVLERLDSLDVDREIAHDLVDCTEIIAHEVTVLLRSISFAGGL